MKEICGSGSDGEGQVSTSKYLGLVNIKTLVFVVTQRIDTPVSHPLSSSLYHEDPRSTTRRGHLELNEWNDNRNGCCGG